MSGNDKEFNVAKPISRFQAMKYRLAIAGASGMSLVGYASAATFDINATVGPLVDGITGLIPSLTALVMALIPLFIVMAVAKFFPDLFDSILSKLRM
jgi:hypothetical protein